MYVYLGAVGRVRLSECDFYVACCYILTRERERERNMAEDSESHSFAEIYDEIFSSVVGVEEEEEEEKIRRLGSLSTPELLRRVLRSAGKVEVSGVGRLHPPPCTESNVRALKEAGARAFQKRNYALAVEAFSRLIETCSAFDGLPPSCRWAEEALRQGYANRSASLQRAGLAAQCLADVEMALELSEAPDEEYLLLGRKGKCLAAEGAPAAGRAREAFEQAVAAANKRADLLPQLRDAFLAQAEGEMSKLSQPRREEEPRREKRLVSELEERLLSGAQAGAFSSLSEAVAPSYAGQERGRILKAERRIFPGETILVETPLVSFTHCARRRSEEEGGEGDLFIGAPGPKVASVACHHCLGSLARGGVYYPSRKVYGIRFCSPKCYKEANEK